MASSSPRSPDPPAPGCHGITSASSSARNQIGSKMNSMLHAYQCGFHGSERPHPVVHRVVQQNVAQRRDQRAQIQESPSRRNDRVFPAQSPHHPHQRHRRQRHHRRADEGVRPTAMVLQLLHRTLEPPHHVQIRSFRCQRHGQRRIGRFAIEPGAPKARPGQKMRYRFHAFFQERSCSRVSNP